MKNLKLSVKLIGGFVITAVITILVGLQDRLALNAMEDELHYLGAVEMPAVEAALDLKVDVQRIRSNTHLILSQIITTQGRRDAHEQVRKIRAEMAALMEKYRAMPGRSADQDTALKTFESGLQEWQNANDKVLKISEELIAADVPKPDLLASDLRHVGSKHHELMNNVAKLLLFGAHFDGGTDGDKCPLGQWLVSYSTTNADVNALIARLKPEHYALHESVAALKKMIEAGQVDDAKKEYKDRTIPAAQKVFGIFSELLEISNTAQKKFQAMETIFSTEVVKTRDAVLGGIDRLVELNIASGQRHKDEAIKNSSSVKLRSVFMVLAGAVLAVGIGVVLTLAITRPLFQGVALAKAMAAGDLSKSMDVHQKDEIGVLADALNAMATNLRTMMHEIVAEVTKMNSASVTLAGIAEQMTSGANTSVQRASQVSASVSQMSENQVSVAAAMEQASVNVNTVATATEEMSATIGEIASNSGKAKTITDQAVQQAAEASTRVNELGVAANEINKVTETITAISSQTNLLALNATIEAARAGDAGRGFAVVANEIKELAQQTAHATEEIRAKIQGIQKATSLTVGEIEDISHVIGEVDAIVATIAAAVEEQSVTTREIADNVGQASAGIAEVNSKVAQDSAMAGEISADIRDVTAQANETLLSSEQVKLSASGLSDTASKLKNLVARFQLSA